MASILILFEPAVGEGGMDAELHRTRALNFDVDVGCFIRIVAVLGRNDNLTGSFPVDFLITVIVGRLSVGEGFENVDMAFGHVLELDFAWRRVIIDIDDKQDCLFAVEVDLAGLYTDANS